MELDLQDLEVQGHGRWVGAGTSGTGRPTGRIHVADAAFGVARGAKDVVESMVAEKLGDLENGVRTATARLMWWGLVSVVLLLSVIYGVRGLGAYSIEIGRSPAEAHWTMASSFAGVALILVIVRQWLFSSKARKAQKVLI